MAIDAQRISATLVELADTLVSDYDLIDYLDRLLELTVDVLGADAGGVMLWNGKASDNRLDLLACTDEPTRVVELFELQRQEGPCVDSHLLGEAVVEEDLAASVRWPQFTPVALARGVRAVYAFPLRLRGTGLGALNLFRREPGPAVVADVSAAQAFADMATIGILQQRAAQDARALAGQLQTALNSRVAIEQAKGILAERMTLDVEEAYQVLRWYGRNHNEPLRTVAAAVIAGDLTAAAFEAPPQTQ
jgi:GAF domain-containing protein